MCTKYCEVAMGIKYRRKNDVGEWVGGPAYYLRGLGKKIGSCSASATPSSS